MEKKILESDIDQVLDYAIDLKYFHKFSHDHVIVPILIATNYNSSSTNIIMSVYDDKIVNPLVTGTSGLADLINQVSNHFNSELTINDNWIISPYAPTPTIIEAAKPLYEHHSVEDIFLSSYGEVTKKDIIEKCPDISVKMIEYHLKELLEQEFIKKLKGGRYSSYIRIIK